MNEPLQEEYTFFRFMHPAHLAFLVNPPLVMVSPFLQVLDKLDPDMRHEILQQVAHMLMVGVGREERKELMSDKEALYVDFELRCRKSAPEFNEFFIVQSIVHFTLSELARLGDLTRIDEAKNQVMKLAEHIQEKYNKTSPWLIEHMTDLPEKTEHYYKLYTYFCDNVVQKLIELGKDLNS
jgi:hypothetical protein